MKIVIFFLSLSHLTFAQDSLVKLRKNNIHLSLVGENLFGFSVNYERIFYKKGLFNVGAGIGIGLNFWTRSNAFILPLYVTTLYGRKKHFLIASTGINNEFFLKPNPSTKSEREAFRQEAVNNISIPIDTYVDPYGNNLFVSIGYLFVSKKGFMIQPEISLLRIKQNNLMGAFISPLPIPKLKIGYAF